MKFSAFARFGNGLRFSSKPPLGLTLYRQIIDQNGGVYQSDDFAGPNVGRWFAQAMMISRARSTLERASNQADPTKLWDLLTTVEGTYGLTPKPTDTLASRRQALSAAQQLLLGPRRGNVVFQLQAALGADFVAWVTNAQSPGVNWATTPGVTGQSFPTNPESIGIFDDPAFWKTISITDVISHTGGPITVAWLPVSGDTGTIVVGDELVVAPGLLGQQEKITVTARTDTTLTATFTRPHEANTVAIRRPFPFWLSNQKYSYVVVKNGRARDQTVRQKATAVLSKVLSGISIWDIVEENVVPGTSGPFIPGQGVPGITPIVQLAT